MKTSPAAIRSSVRSALARCRRFCFGTRKRRAVAFSIAFVLCAFYLGLYRAPDNFKEGHIVTIEEGVTLEGIAQQLAADNIIRSPFLFRAGVIALGGETSARAGDYHFGERQGALAVAYRIANARFGLDPVVVRIPEGLSVEEIAAQIEGTLEGFDPELFKVLAKGHEGYLFPDTYYFLPNAKAGDVYRIMRRTFDSRIEEIRDQIDAFGMPLEDVVTMASILEREASDYETKRTIAGVLWNRIEIGMPLQVDAAFVYLLGKGTNQLTLEDLRVDSPYNTYTNTGFPPTPIGNPGLESLRAAVNPEESDYFFYLADKNGITYFSRTFEEHKQKKALYLN